jgi:hypothetical protein
MTIYHFVSESGYEDYANGEEERDAFLAVYLEHYCPFSIDKIEQEDDEDDDLPIDPSWLDDEPSLTAAQRNPSLR